MTPSKYEECSTYSPTPEIDHVFTAGDNSHHACGLKSGGCTTRMDGASMKSGEKLKKSELCLLEASIYYCVMGFSWNSIRCIVLGYLLHASSLLCRCLFTPLGLSRVRMRLQWGAGNGKPQNVHGGKDKDFDFSLVHLFRKDHKDDHEGLPGKHRAEC